MSDLTAVTVVIPSLEPDDRLPPYARALLNAGFGRILVVDDGSGDAYQSVFQAVEDIPGCTVLHHPVNRGKGEALKTAFAHILDNPMGCQAVLTADADGQHTVEDCVRLSSALLQGEDACYLGARDFSLKHVPPKSRIGNRATSIVFLLCNHVYLRDTQTGLRAFRISRLPMLLGVEGSRYEYEMNMLIALSQQKIPMISVTIDTVYENDNAGTHFHPIRDSYRIYKVILGAFVRFMGVSLLCVLVDQLLAGFLHSTLLPALGMTGGSALVWTSGLIARLVSSSLNFALNKSFVFHFRQSTASAAWRYAILCVMSICLSNLGTTLFIRLGVVRWLGKLICDTVLYFVNYEFQQRWVFNGNRKKEAKP